MSAAERFPQSADTKWLSWQPTQSSNQMLHFGFGPISCTLCHNWT